jgi:hypothetical protein
LSLSALEIVPVGRSFCLFRGDTRAAALLNPSAAELAELVIETEVGSAGSAARLFPRDFDSKTVARDLDLMHAQLTEAGFLGIDVPASRQARAPARSPGIDPNWWQARCRAGSGTTYIMVCEDGELALLLAAALAPMQTTGDSHCDGIIAVSGGGEDFTIWREGIRIAGSLNLSDARRLALQTLIVALYPPQDVATLVHGSAVELGGRAVILAGATGSGKTTLSLALAGRGARYLADDITPLGISGRQVLPVPVAASVKQGSWPLIESSFPALARTAVHRVGERIVRYLDTRPFDRTGVHIDDTEPVPAGVVIFPTYAPGAVTSAMPMAPEDALAELLATGTETVGASRSIRPLVRLVEETHCIALTFGSLDAAIAVVRQQLDAP